jgi:hypothetical protein
MALTGLCRGVKTAVVAPFADSAKIAKIAKSQQQRK